MPGHYVAFNFSRTFNCLFRSNFYRFEKTFLEPEMIHLKFLVDKYVLFFSFAMSYLAPFNSCRKGIYFASEHFDISKEKINTLNQISRFYAVCLFSYFIFLHKVISSLCVFLHFTYENHSYLNIPFASKKKDNAHINAP